MSSKSNRIAELIKNCKSQYWAAHYLGFFACFNQSLYFEAHEVLEELWLTDRGGVNYSFYKGLIQLAGAFVHLQKNRLKPAVALFDLATANLGRYREDHEGVRISSLMAVADAWRARILEENFERNPINDLPAPQLALPAKPTARGDC